jgi:cytochrome c biogenesis protein
MSTDVEQKAALPEEPEDRPRASELGPLELFRYGWRQLTSMRTALVLLLLLALAAIPGSVIPQKSVDSIGTTQWKSQHPDLTPVFERLGLFAVYDTPWFASIYILLVISLVGCIIPRTAVYFRGMRALPPAAPSRLSRMPGHAAYDVEESPVAVLDDAERVLRSRGYRILRSDASPDDDDDGANGGWVSAERGYLREAGNLLFHLSVLVVLVGFAIGSMFGYRGGAIVLVGGGFSNTATQYDELDPGSLFGIDDFSPPFSFTIDDFDIEWLTEGPSAGQARAFVSHLTYQETPDAVPETYDLKVNHPLDIGGTEVFLIGHGYAPVITVRDGNGDIAFTGPTIFLPRNPTFASFGVVKAPDALPKQIGLTGEFYPTYDFTMERGPYSLYGDVLNPALSMTVFTGDLGMDAGTGQSVYLLDTETATPVLKDDGTPFRVDLELGESADLPDGLGSVSFDDVQRWNKVQISRTPGKLIALSGVLLALLGLLGSLFIRPRRIWVRARRTGDEGDAGTLVEVAGLDRSGNGDLPREVAHVAAAMGLREPPEDESFDEEDGYDR